MFRQYYQADSTPLGNLIRLLKCIATVAKTFSACLLLRRTSKDVLTEVLRFTSELLCRRLLVWKGTKHHATNLTLTSPILLTTSKYFTITQTKTGFYSWAHFSLNRLSPS